MTRLRACGTTSRPTMPVVVFWAHSILLARRPAWNSILHLKFFPLSRWLSIQMLVMCYMRIRRPARLGGLQAQVRKCAPKQAVRLWLLPGHTARAEAGKVSSRLLHSAKMGALSLILSDPLALPYLLKVKVGCSFPSSRLPPPEAPAPPS